MEPSEVSGSACGLCGTPLVILKIQVDGFFLYEAYGKGGKTQKCSLRPRLGVFQILEIGDCLSCLELISDIFGAVRS